MQDSFSHLFLAKLDFLKPREELFPCMWIEPSSKSEVAQCPTGEGVGDCFVHPYSDLDMLPHFHVAHTEGEAKLPPM